MLSRTFWLLLAGLLLSTGSFLNSNIAHIYIRICLAFVVKAEDGTVEDEAEGEATKQAETKETKEEDDYPRKVGPSPDAQASIYFIDPPSAQGL